MSNFAATLGPILERLSPLVKATSEIIDAFSNGKYVFLEVSVEFGICFPLRFLRLGTATSFEALEFRLQPRASGSTYGMLKGTRERQSP